MLGNWSRGAGALIYFVYLVYSVCSVYFVYLFRLVYLVCFVYARFSKGFGLRGMLAPSLGRPQLSFGREGFPQVQILENRSASAKPLRETPPPVITYDARTTGLSCMEPGTVLHHSSFSSLSIGATASAMGERTWRKVTKAFSLLVGILCAAPWP